MIPAIFDAQPDFLKTTINRERFFWRWNTEQKYQTNMRAYYRMVSGIDGAIGRFMKALEEAGFADNTIIVYSADNGYHMGNRGFAGKWSHYEESLRVPLIVWTLARAKAQRGTSHRCPCVELGPAVHVSGLGGDRTAEPLSGSQLEANRQRRKTGRLANRDRSTSTSPSGTAFPPLKVCATSSSSTCRYFDHGNSEFLHDLKNDPDELVNLADDPRHADTLKAMRERTDAASCRVRRPA